jgi:ATP-dependent DNA helicase RecG
MTADERKVLEMTRRGEGLDLEFKTCRNQLNHDVYETVCAFLNRHGGTMLLGVQDDEQYRGLTQTRCNRYAGILSPRLPIRRS